jgi:serine protein kinase
MGKDGIFGIDVHLMKFVNFFKSAAAGYGTEIAEGKEVTVL